jgi:hypothetical protein
LKCPPRRKQKKLSKNSTAKTWMDAKSPSTRQGPRLTVAAGEAEAVLVAEVVVVVEDEVVMAAAEAVAAAEIATDSRYCSKSKYATAGKHLLPKTYYRLIQPHGSLILLPGKE